MERANTNQNQFLKDTSEKEKKMFGSEIKSPVDF
jgi:hypothetical protein